MACIIFNDSAVRSQSRFFAASRIVPRMREHLAPSASKWGGRLLLSQIPQIHDEQLRVQRNLLNILLSNLCVKAAQRPSCEAFTSSAVPGHRSVPHVPFADFSGFNFRAASKTNSIVSVVVAISGLKQGLSSGSTGSIVSPARRRIDAAALT
jgi:hypothetical protein